MSYCNCDECRFVSDIPYPLSGEPISPFSDRMKLKHSTRNVLKICQFTIPALYSAICRMPHKVKKIGFKRFMYVRSTSSGRPKDTLSKIFISSSTSRKQCRIENLVSDFLFQFYQLITIISVKSFNIQYLLFCRIIFTFIS